MRLESYSYSPRNLLSNELVSRNNYNYYYDGRGLRLRIDYLPWRSQGWTRLFAYDPELHLIAETTMMTIPRIPPPWAYEYIWFAGVPVAQANSGGTTLWTMTDHLGTPFEQTLSDGSVAWRVEAEPYGWEYSLRSGTDRHQPLRFPGQEAEQLDLGINGSTERSYNIFRWYRAKWGRYSQADPIGVAGGLDVFTYVADSPTYASDPLGLKTCRCHRALSGFGSKRHESVGLYHDYFRIGPSPRCEDNPSYGFTHDTGGGLIMVFSYRGRVDKNDPNRTDEKCEWLPCVSDQKALDFVNERTENPGPYACVGRSCQTFGNELVRRATIPGCCWMEAGPTGH